MAVSDVAILVTEAGLYRRSALCSPRTSPFKVVTIKPWFSALKPNDARLSAYAAESARRGVRRQSGVIRKSTRLNSSHSQISYAVFCLKKKKKPQQAPVTDN